MTFSGFVVVSLANGNLQKKVQGLGNILPFWLAAAGRLLTFAAPLLWMGHRSGIELRHVWYLSVASVTLQALTSLWLLHRELKHRELKRRLQDPPQPVQTKKAEPPDSARSSVKVAGEIP